MDFFAAARTQLSLEYGCQPSDFLQNENLLTTSFLHPARRRYRNRPAFFQMATFGHCAVLTADPILHPFSRVIVASGTVGTTGSVGGSGLFCVFFFRLCLLYSVSDGAVYTRAAYS